MPNYYPSTQNSHLAWKGMMKKELLKHIKDCIFQTSTNLQGVNVKFAEQHVLKCFDQKEEIVFKEPKLAHLYQIIADNIVYLSTVHPDYSLLAGRILTRSIHLMVPEDIVSVVENIKKKAPTKIGQDILEIIKKHGKRLNDALNHSNDMNMDYFAVSTAMKNYMAKTKDELLERWQHVLMRVSLGIHKDDIEAALQTYKLMSEQYFIHATPTMLNCGTENPQCCSCFVLGSIPDSLEAIYDTLKDCATISKNGGGVGFAMHGIRCTGSSVGDDNSPAAGVIKFLELFDVTTKVIRKCGSRKPGMACWLAPWHYEIEQFIDLKLPHGLQERHRNLFYGLWVPDLFMKRVKENKNWSLFDPHQVPRLLDTWGSEFEYWYNKYEKEEKAKKTIPAVKLFEHICKSQMESGMPYMMYADTCNRTSNHNHLGTITGSNLCTEIVQYNTKEEPAVCNLASISLPRFVKNGKFDFQKLFQVVQVITHNLDKIIDLNKYPTEAAKRSNMKHRPIGIGVQGLADLFFMLKLPYTSIDARTLNKRIFETIYYASLNASIDIAQKKGPYASYKGSFLSKGILHIDHYSVELSGMWDWYCLREKLKKYGARNSLFVAQMPTATTSQILGNTESVEPPAHLIEVRATNAGEFVCVNKHFIRDMIQRGLWNHEMFDMIVEHQGSIQKIPNIPKELKELYKTAYDIKKKDILQMAVDRNPYIDQSQSLSLFNDSPDPSVIASIHMFGWQHGLKTGMYYHRGIAAKETRQKGIMDAIFHTDTYKNDDLDVICEACSA